MTTDSIEFNCATCGDLCNANDGQQCEGCGMAFCPECYIDHECSGIADDADIGDDDEADMSQL